MNRRELLRRARRRWPAAELRVEADRTALKAPARVEARWRLDRCKERIEAIGRELPGLKTAGPDLAAAAVFVVDVAGDPPSIDRLGAAVKRFGQREALVAERAELTTERRRLSALCCRRPYAIYRRHGIAWQQVASGDTLAEVAERAGLVEVEAGRAGK